MSARIERLVRLAGIFDFLTPGKVTDKKLAQVLSKVILHRHPELQDQVAAATSATNPIRAFQAIRVPEFSYMKPNDVNLAMLELRMHPRRDKIEKQVKEQAERIIRQIVEASKAEKDLERTKYYSAQREEEDRQFNELRQRIVTETWEHPIYGQKSVSKKLDHNGQELDRTVQGNSPGWKDLAVKLDAAFRTGDRREVEKVTGGLKGTREIWQPTNGFFPRKLVSRESLTGDTPDDSFLWAE